MSMTPMRSYLDDEEDKTDRLAIKNAKQRNEVLSEKEIVYRGNKLYRFICKKINSSQKSPFHLSFKTVYPNCLWSYVVKKFKEQGHKAGHIYNDESGTDYLKIILKIKI